MASHFEEHCWKDVVSPEALALYKAYEREIYVGERPALLAIDLYNLVYEGGNRPVNEIYRDHPSTCGEHAWAALEPCKRLFAAARAAGIPIFYTTVDLDVAVQATERRVNKLGVRSLIVCGETTSGCVRASVVDAYSNGYHTVVAEECTYDRHLLSHKVNLFDLHHKYADVMHLHEVIENLK